LVPASSLEGNNLLGKESYGSLKVQEVKSKKEGRILKDSGETGKKKGIEGKRGRFWVGKNARFQARQGEKE